MKPKILQRVDELENVTDRHTSDLAENVQQIDGHTTQINNLDINKANKDEVNTLTINKVDKGGNEQVTLAMLAQEVKTAMTGGSVAVVEGESVNTSNIVNKAVIPEKTSFVDIEESMNKFNVNSTENKEGYYLKWDNTEVVSESNGITHKINVKPGDVLRFYYSSNTSTNWGVLYDINDNKLASINSNITGSTLQNSKGWYYREVIIPVEQVNASYVKLNYTLAEKSTREMVTINESFPDSYIEYFKNYILQKPLVEKYIPNVTDKLINKLYGKSIVWFGDSITDSVNKGWAVKIPERNNMLSTNLAKSGSTISYRQKIDETTTANNCISKSIEDNISSYVGKDYVILSGGINDAFGGSLYTLGTLSSDYTTAITDKEETILGALENAIRLVYKNCLGSKIGYILTPCMPTATKQDLVFEGIITLLKKYSIPYLDLRYVSGLCAGIDEVNTAYFQTGDRTHPTEDGYIKYLNDKVENFLLSL